MAVGFNVGEYVGLHVGLLLGSDGTAVGWLTSVGALDGYDGPRVGSDDGRDEGP